VEPALERALDMIYCRLAGLDVERSGLDQDAGRAAVACHTRQAFDQLEGAPFDDLGSGATIGMQRAAGFNRVRRANRVDAGRVEDRAMAQRGDAADAEREAVLLCEAIAQLGDQPDETTSDVAEANQREVQPLEPVQTAAVSSSTSSRRRPSVRIAGSAPNPIRR
jgi:hypothetical protein